MAASRRKLGQEVAVFKALKQLSLRPEKDTGFGASENCCDATVDTMVANAQAPKHITAPMGYTQVPIPLQKMKTCSDSSGWY